MKIKVTCTKCGKVTEGDGVEMREILGRLDAAHDLLSPDCPNVGVPTATPVPPLDDADGGRRGD